MFCPRCQLYCAAGKTCCSECDFDFAVESSRGAVHRAFARIILVEGKVQSVKAAGAALEDAGIDFWIMRRRGSQKNPHMPLAKVEVRMEDEDAAREALADGAHKGLFEPLDSKEV